MIELLTTVAVNLTHTRRVTFPRLGEMPDRIRVSTSSDSGFEARPLLFLEDMK